MYHICAQNAYLWSYEPLKLHVKSSIFAKITFENTTSGFTEKTVNGIVSLKNLHLHHGPRKTLSKGRQNSNLIEWCSEHCDSLFRESKKYIHIQSGSGGSESKLET